MEHPFLMFLDLEPKILGSNPTGGMDICLLLVSCVVR